MLLLLTNEMLLKLVQLSILPGDFSTAIAAAILGQSSCPYVTAMNLRHLSDLGLIERGARQGIWCMQTAIRAAAAELSLCLQLPLISVRCLPGISLMPTSNSAATSQMSLFDDISLIFMQASSVSRHSVCFMRGSNNKHLTACLNRQKMWCELVLAAGLPMRTK